MKRFDDEDGEEGERIEIARVQTTHDSRVYTVDPEVSTKVCLSFSSTCVHACMHARVCL